MCDVCNEIEFNMKLQNVDSKIVCHRCYKNILSNDPALYFVENLINSESLSPQLSSLIIIKEMLIARAHVQMKISRVRDC